MNKLLSIVSNLESKICFRDVIKLDVSRVSVGWHIEHTLMATIVIIDQLLKSDPTKYKWGFNINRMIVFSLNKIPRGAGNAPKSVQPSGKMSTEKLLKYIEIAKEKIHAMYDMKPGNHFTHPYLGVLNNKSGIKFMLIHAKHHLKIIEEIIKGQK